MSFKKNGIWGRKGELIQMWAERIYFLYPRIHHNPGIFEGGGEVVKGVFIKMQY